MQANDYRQIKKSLILKNCWAEILSLIICSHKIYSKVRLSKSQMLIRASVVCWLASWFYEVYGRVLGILKKVSWVESYLGRRWLAFACSRRPWVGVTWDGGGGADEKARIERMCISLLILKNL